MTAALSRLGFGVTGPHATKLVSADATVRLIREAIDLGVATFDTGPMYGGGEAERRLGAALKGVPRDRLFVITKIRTFSRDGAFCPPPEVQLAYSLRRLGLAYVDALLLHGPRPEDFQSHILEGDLREIKVEGFARRIGVCGRGAERAAMLDAEHWDIFDLLMTPLDDPALLARAAAQGVDVIAIETMRARRRFRTPRALADVWYLARDLRDAATGVPQPQGPGLKAALALPAVRSAIVTTTRLAHLQANVAAAGVIRQTG